MNVQHYLKRNIIKSVPGMEKVYTNIHLHIVKGIKNDNHYFKGLIVIADNDVCK